MSLGEHAKKIETQLLYPLKHLINRIFLVCFAFYQKQTSETSAGDGIVCGMSNIVVVPYNPIRSTRLRGITTNSQNVFL